MENLFQTFFGHWDWWQASGIAAGGLIVWLLARWKSVTEIKVLKSELATRHVSLFEKMIALDEKQRHIVRNLNEALRQMLVALAAGNADQARQHRTEAVNLFLLDFIGSYYSYAGIGRWIYQDNKDELIDDELLPFLETSADMLQILNGENLLKLTGSQPLKVQGFDFQFAVRYIRRNTPHWNWKRRLALQEAELRLLGGT